MVDEKDLTSPGFSLGSERFPWQTEEVKWVPRKLIFSALNHWQVWHKQGKQGQLLGYGVKSSWGGGRCSQQSLLLTGMKGVGQDGSQCILEAAQGSLNSGLLVRCLYTLYGLNLDPFQCEDESMDEIRQGLFRPAEM